MRLFAGRSIPSLSDALRRWEMHSLGDARRRRSMRDAVGRCLLSSNDLRHRRMICTVVS
jgi:hypothetical protein